MKKFRTCYITVVLLCGFYDGASAHTFIIGDTIINSRETLKAHAITNLSSAIDITGGPKNVELIKQFCGTWRWVSGNRDTLILFIKPIIPQIKGSKNNISVDFFGFHTYIEKGILVESSSLSINDTAITNSTTISGNLIANELDFSLLDLTRNTYLFLTLTPLQNLSSRAWLKYNGKDHGHHPTTAKRLFPPGKTIPTDIVMEKISNTY